MFYNIFNYDCWTQLLKKIREGMDTNSLGFIPFPFCSLKFPNDASCLCTELSTICGKNYQIL
ncbi:MAG: hypothetical protein RIS64_564 [Bacteroidota bacterium]|jgi:hypothetical protein